MHSKRSIQLSTLFTLVAMLLAACGGTAATPAATTAPVAGNPTSAPAAAPTTAAAPSGQPATIRWRTRPGDAAEQAVYQKLADDANGNLKAQNITVTYEPGVNQGYFEKLKTELAAGNAPDIFWVGAVELADFVNTGQNSRHQAVCRQGHELQARRLLCPDRQRAEPRRQGLWPAPRHLDDGDLLQR